MKKRLYLFLSYAAFWLIFFVAARLLFISYYAGKTAELGVADILLSIIHGLRLDLSAMGYFCLIPGLILVGSVFYKPLITKYSLSIYTLIMLFFCSFIVVFDLEMYKHWGFRLDATPLLYIGQDTTVAISFASLAKLILIWILFIAMAVRLYTKWILPKIDGLDQSNWKTALILLLLTGCMIGPIRGTTGVAPINTGTVYYHPNNMYANHAAINVVWNTGYALSKINRLKYPKYFFDADSTATYFEKLYATSGETTSLLSTEKPNVLLIILESYTYQLIEPMGGMPGITPNFNQLISEGVLFDNFYSSGDRTDKGIVSILSGYPAQPTGSIIKYPKKTQKLPFLNKKFDEMGYQTGFTYGGNIDFANFRSYMSNAGFDSLTHSGAFPDSLNTSKWGVHDEFVFEKFYKELNKMPAPFFKVMLSLSSHEPFEVPMQTVIEGESDRDKFLNSAFYTDKELGEFIEKAKASDWWDNSLIVITADHGHSLPEGYAFYDPNKFRIPMLWLGGALTKQDTIIHTYGTQTDIPNTILGQLGQTDKSFTFSRDLLSARQRDFALYIYNNGFGYLNDSSHVIYDNVGKQYAVKKGISKEEQLAFPKAYLQTLYTDYNHR